jgi:hypothetical protein
MSSQDVTQPRQAKASFTDWLVDNHPRIKNRFKIPDLNPRIPTPALITPQKAEPKGEDHSGDSSELDSLSTSFILESAQKFYDAHHGQGFASVYIVDILTWLFLPPIALVYAISSLVSGELCDPIVLL